MHGRVFGIGSFKQRDFYDFLTCALRDPAALQAVLDSVWVDDLESLSSELKSEPRNFQDQEIIAPERPQWLDSWRLRADFRQLLDLGIERFVESLRRRNGRRST